MSVYYRFFIKTRSPKRVEEVIVAALGGDAWLETYRDGYLQPLEVASPPGQSLVIYPKRDKHGRPVTSEVSSDWFWLDSMIGFNTPQAAAVASALLAETKFRYPLLELVAVDTDASDQKSDGAVIVRDASRLWDRQAPLKTVLRD